MFAIIFIQRLSRSQRLLKYYTNNRARSVSTFLHLLFNTMERHHNSHLLIILAECIPKLEEKDRQEFRLLISFGGIVPLESPMFRATLFLAIKRPNSLANVR